MDVSPVDGIKATSQDSDGLWSMGLGWHFVPINSQVIPKKRQDQPIFEQIDKKRN